MKYAPYVLLVGAMALFPYCVQRVFLNTPIEAEMGTAQKIFYFHVPLAWMMHAARRRLWGGRGHPAASRQSPAGRGHQPSRPAS